MHPVDFVLIAIALSFLIVLTAARLFDALPSRRLAGHIAPERVSESKKRSAQKPIVEIGSTSAIPSYNDFEVPRRRWREDDALESEPTVRERHA